MTREQARQKAKEIISQMTLEEKASQLLYNSPAIPRLNIHEFNWWNEGLHGVARNDVATVFPQAIGMAATFDPEQIYCVADAISTEARIKSRTADESSDHGIYKNLTFWSPNINIFRDGRWGRGQETYGEDPFLTSRMGVNFVKGIQGDGGFLKAAACAKHFAAHSGPEKIRHSFDAEVSKKDLFETYLPAFEALVKEADVEGVMGAYNRVNGEPACAHKYLMGEILFDDWGFDGYFVSDCGALADIHGGHAYTSSPAETAALALKLGCNINCGATYSAVLDAVKQGLVDEETIDQNLIRAYTTRVLLGEFENEKPYSYIPFEKLDSNEHRALNLETARRSLVLLKNDGILPLDKNSISPIAVIGPCARSIPSLIGNYCGEASEYITIVDGIRRETPDRQIFYTEGCHIILSNPPGDRASSYLDEARAAAAHAETVILCVGLNSSVEGEELPISNDYCDGGDRLSVGLPEVQLELIREVTKVNKNVIIVITAGSPVDIGEELTEKARAIIDAWYPGALGGRAIAELIYGDFSPSGKLPITFPKESAVLPDMSDYSMHSRTYRYSGDEPAFPFGFGLSYADFSYGDLELLGFSDEDGAEISFTIKNGSNFSARTTTQVYTRFTDSRTETPLFQLCGLNSCVVSAGAKRQVTMHIDPYWLMAVTKDGERVVPNGGIELFVGDHQPDFKSCELCGTRCLRIRVK